MRKPRGQADERQQRRRLACVGSGRTAERSLDERGSAREQSERRRRAGGGDYRGKKGSPATVAETEKEEHAGQCDEEATPRRRQIADRRNSGDRNESKRPRHGAPCPDGDRKQERRGERHEFGQPVPVVDREAQARAGGRDRVTERPRRDEAGKEPADERNRGHRDDSGCESDRGAAGAVRKRDAGCEHEHAQVEEDARKLDERVLGARCPERGQAGPDGERGQKAGAEEDRLGNWPCRKQVQDGREENCPPEGNSEHRPRRHGETAAVERQQEDDRRDQQPNRDADRLNET